MKHSSQWPQMLYRTPGPTIIEGTGYALHLVHSDDELAAALADGWHETTAAASAPDSREPQAAGDSPVASEGAEDAEDAAPPTRAELEQKATELGVSFDGRTTDKKLRARIDAALEA